MPFGVWTWIWASPLRDADVLAPAERVPGLCSAACLWRLREVTGDALATAGLAFLRKSLA